MASWTLVPCLTTLRSEFDTLNPARDHGSDGSIGDRAHQDRPSSHNPDETGETPYEDPDSVNEVHAIDVDRTGPWPAGRTMLDSVEIIRIRHKRGDDNRLQNIIYRGQIASRSWGWTWKNYTGSNGHFEHAHFESVYTAAQEADTRPWGLLRREADDMEWTDKPWGSPSPISAADALQQASRADDALKAVERVEAELVDVKATLAEVLRRLPPPPAVTR